MNDVDFKLIAESIPQIVWMAAPDGANEYVNERGMEYTGLPRETARGWDWVAAIHPEDREHAERTWRAAVAAGERLVAEWRLRHHDGEYRWNEARALPVRDADGAILKWIGTVIDIDDRRRLEESLRSAERDSAESLALLETLLEAAPVGFGFIDREFRQIRANEAMAATSGIPVPHQLGRAVAEIIPELWDELEPVYRQVLDTGEAVINRETSGTLGGDPGCERTWLASWYPVRVQDEVIGVGSVLVDITERKEAELKLQRLSERDPLTGLFNRRKLLDELARILGYAARYWHAGAVLLLDVDNFKWANDTYGHATGDQMLCSIAAILTSRLRESDVVARIGGDEFAVVLPEASEEQALAVARDLRRLLCERTGGPPIYTSIGVALFDGHNPPTVDDVLMAADVAMYQVKNAGGDDTTVYRGRSVELTSRIGSIRGALAEGRFAIHGQPIFDLRSDRAVAHELLIRMTSTDGETIQPGEFLPLAERFSLVVPIDRHVVGKALHLARDRRVSVNLSARSMGDPMILAAVRQAVGAGLDPGNLVFELTETAVMTDFERALQFVSSLTSLGCAFALDDFGTGFCSFSYLKSFPARYVKIDMEFVRGVSTDPADREIVRAIVDIAHTLGKQTVAEGVESEEILQTLRQLEVDYAQGFHLGRPAPIQ